MAAASDAERFHACRDKAGASLRIDGIPEEYLGPIIAGAFTRGIAETLDVLGVAAVFLDRAGHVLFASKAADVPLKRDLVLQAGHLLSRDHAENEVLSNFVAAVLSEPSHGRSIELGSGLTLSTLPVPGESAPSDQLLHAIVVMKDGSAPSADRSAVPNP